MNSKERAEFQKAETRLCFDVADCKFVAVKRQKFVKSWFSPKEKYDSLNVRMFVEFFDFQSYI